MPNKYLGEFPVDISETPFHGFTPADWAMYYIETYGQYDGGWHKQWCMDQIARILKGTPVIVVQARWTDHDPEYRVSTGEESEAYKAWVIEMKGECDEENEEFEYDYDVGIAP